jgi:hypothetical protein
MVDVAMVPLHAVMETRAIGGPAIHQAALPSPLLQAIFRSQQRGGVSHPPLKLPRINTLSSGGYR